MSDLFPGLEKGAGKLVGNFPHQDACLWSIAVSLKRIADSLERIEVELPTCDD